MDRRIKYDLDHCYFISDTHFGDKIMIRVFHRPFNNIDEMNNTIYNNIVNTVSKNDTLFFLGDGGSNLEPFERLIVEKNIKLVWILGNHDDPDTINSLIGGYNGIKIYDNPIMVGGLWLSHEPIECILPECPYLNIHGHTHLLNYGNGGKWLNGNRYFNVSVEAINYKPISLNDIAKQIEYSL